MFPIDMLIKWKWPINVKIRYPRSGGEKWWFDRARREKDKITKKEFYKIRGLNAKAKAALFKNMVETNRGTYVEFYSPSPYEYYPCKIEEKTINNRQEKWVNEDSLLPCELTKEEILTLKNGNKIEKRGEVIPMEEDQKMFWADVVHHVNERWQKQSWWEKYGPMIIPIVTIAMIGMAFLFMSYAWMNYVVPGMNRLGGSIGALADKFDVLFSSYEKVLGGAKQASAGIPPPA